MPQTKKIIEDLGERIKLARIRRKLSTKLICERAGISRATLCQVEKGSASPSIGTYINVLMALGGMDKEFDKILDNDIVGNNLNEIELLKKRIRTWCMIMIKIFMYDNGGFSLSPCFDVNPTAYGKKLSLNIDKYDSTISFDLLLSTSRYFCLDDTSANIIIDDIIGTIDTNFEKECKKIDISMKYLV